MTMETIYKKIIIKSEADLPKNDTYCYTHSTISGEANEKLWKTFYQSGMVKMFLNEIDWYLLAVDLPTDEEIGKEIPDYHIEFGDEQYEKWLNQYKYELFDSFRRGAKWLRDKLLNNPLLK